MDQDTNKKVERIDTVWIPAQRHAGPIGSGLPDRWLVCELTEGYPPYFEDEGSAWNWINDHNYLPHYVRPIPFKADNNDST